MNKNPITYYSISEEKLNVWSHFIGLILSIAGLTLLVIFSSLYGTAWHIVSFSIFGSSLVVLYLASTLYHRSTNAIARQRLNVFDHAAIYVLIAGTYTPYCLVSLNGPIGWVLFGIAWFLALAGITLKIFYTGRFNVLSTISYILMGWIAIFAAKPLYLALQTEALVYLVLGGASYTAGAIIYSINKIPYNHAIFHLFVLAGSVLHFISIFFYLL